MSKGKRKNEALKLMKKWPVKFQKVDLETAREVPKWCTRAFFNNRYFITIDDNAKTTKGVATKVMIQNHFNTPIVGHWKEIYNIKNELFGEDTTAVEYHPAKTDLIDDKNIYWIWIFKNNELPIPIF